MSWQLSRREWMGTAGALAWGGLAWGDQQDEAAGLKELLDGEFQKHDLKALLCGVWRGKQQVLKTAIGESMTSVPATTDMHLRVGGVTLTCVCVVLLQMVDRGLVTLDTPIAQWYPKLPHADQVTLRMLANCTAGYPDYVPMATFEDAFEKNPFRQWTPQELIDIAMQTPPHYAPGKGWNYSHTNFVILGEILEKIADKPMAKLIEENITRPLGLKQTVYCDTPQIPRPVLHAFTTERGKYEESTFWNPSWTSHSGLMISTLGDMGTLAAAIGAGKLLKKETRAEMTAPTTVGLGINQENLYYAMGIGVMDDWLVQNPRFGGYTVLFANLPEEDLTVIVANTLGPKASPDIAYATLIFKEIVKRLTPQHLIPEMVK